MTDDTPEGDLGHPGNGQTPPRDAPPPDAREAESAAAGQEVERTVRARGRFFTSASHDLRQPLSALSLFIGALDNRLHDSTSRDILKAMSGAVQAMKTLVDAHLDIARIDAGVLRAESGSHPINGILTRLALEFAPQFDEKRLRFNVHPSSALIHSDRDLLERILRHLLSNALHHTDHGRVAVGCRRSGDWLRIEVWDTGRGIPSDQLDIIQEEFAQLDDPGRETFQGFGLGLSLVVRLARLLGHRLDVRSTPGKGSMFAILVPLVRDTQDDVTPPAVGSPSDSEQPAETDPADVSHACVLVIEDDLLVLDALQILLNQWGCRVIGAASYEEAMARLENTGTSLDLIIADFRLKGAATGVVAIRQISKALCVDIPGLIITGDTDPRRLREAKLSGYPLLHKPVTPLALRTAAARLLGRGRLRP